MTPSLHTLSTEGAPLGTVITFYSFKGGVGRSMALANLAVLLARAKKRVLCVDWDLEAPGLDRYFHSVPRANPLLSPRMVPPAKKGGLLSILENFSVDAIAPWQAYVQTRTGFDGSAVDMIGSGDDAEDYSSRLSNFTWADYFAKRQGGQTIEQLRTEWKAAYDYVLVDSRTGLTDASGVCTIQMPDLLLMLFAANKQSTEWSSRVAHSVREARRSLPYDRAFLKIVPLLSRFDAREESDRAAAEMDRIAAVFEPFFGDWLPGSIKARDMLVWSVLPYIPRYSFEEALAVEDEPETGAQGLAFYYQLLSRLILARFQDVRRILAGVGVPGAALPPLIPGVSELRAELQRDPGAVERYREAIAQRAKEEPLEAADALETLASVLATTFRFAEAEQLLTQAVTIYADPRVGKTQDASRVMELHSEISANARLAATANKVMLSESAIDSEFLGEDGAGFLEAEGKVEDAIDALQRQHDRLVEQGDSHGQARLLKKLAGVMQRVGRFEEAMDALQRSCDLFAAKGDARGHAVTLNSLAGVMQRLGRFEEAMDALQRSCDLFAAKGDARGHAMTLNSLAGVMQRLGRFEEAMDTLQRSCDLFAAKGDARGHAMTLNSLAGVMQRLGQFEGAMDALQRSCDLFAAKGDARGHAMTLNSLGEVMQRLGQFEGAMDALQRSCDLFAAKGDARGHAMALNSLAGVMQRLGRFEEAMDALQRSCDLFAAQGDARGHAMALNSLAGVMQRLGRFEEAMDTLQRSRDLVQGLHDQVGHATEDDYQRYRIAQELLIEEQKIQGKLDGHPTFFISCVPGATGDPAFKDIIDTWASNHNTRVKFGTQLGRYKDIRDGVIRRIEESTAFLGVWTKKGSYKLVGGEYWPLPWLHWELGVAAARGKPVRLLISDEINKDAWGIYSDIPHVIFSEYNFKEKLQEALSVLKDLVQFGMVEKPPN